LCFGGNKDAVRTEARNQAQNKRLYITQILKKEPRSFVGLVSIRGTFERDTEGRSLPMVNADISKNGDDSWISRPFLVDTGSVRTSITEGLCW